MAVYWAWTVLCCERRRARDRVRDSTLPMVDFVGWIIVVCLCYVCCVGVCGQGGCVDVKRRGGMR